MSVRGTLGGIFAAVSVLVIGWQAGATALHATSVTQANGTTSGVASSGTAATTTSSGGTSASASPSSTPSSSTTSSPSSSSSSTGSSSTSALKDGSYTGQSVTTRYGTIQVAITVSGGRITAVTTPVLEARDGRSQSINGQAVPLLTQEVLAAQSAQVSMISGATYTSDGYLSSLQSALDQA